MWKLKVLIQFVLSKLPLGERINFFLQRLNQSHSVDKLETRILDLTSSLMKVNKYLPLEGITVVEIGTGWEPVNAILLYLLGANICHTYDHVRHVRFELAKLVISAINNKLGEISDITSIPATILSERMSRISNTQDLDDLFAKSHIVYHAPGDASRTNLPDDSVDLVYSHAVLEHVPARMVLDITIESKRILKESGFAYHLIGLHDHYVGFDKNISRVNFLKYSERLWAFFVYNDISYHNRLREVEFLRLFHKCGAKICRLENRVDQRDIDVLKGMRINKRFQGMSLEQLAIHLTEVMMSFPKANSRSGDQVTREAYPGNLKI